MDEQNTQPKSPQKEEEFCVVAGRLAGAVARRLYTLQKQVEKQLIKLSQSGYRATQQALKKGKAVAKDSSVICKGLERKFELWRGEQKLQGLLTQLGAEVARLHQEETTDLVNQPKIKSLIKQIRDMEQSLEETRKASRPKKPNATKTTVATTKKTRKGASEGKTGPEPIPEPV